MALLKWCECVLWECFLIGRIVRKIFGALDSDSIPRLYFCCFYSQNTKPLEKIQCFLRDCICCCTLLLLFLMVIRPIKNSFLAWFFRFSGNYSECRLTVQGQHCSRNNKQRSSPGRSRQKSTAVSFTGHGFERRDVVFRRNIYAASRLRAAELHSTVPPTREKQRARDWESEREAYRPTATPSVVGE